MLGMSALGSAKSGWTHPVWNEVDYGPGALDPISAALTTRFRITLFRSVSATNAEEHEVNALELAATIARNTFDRKEECPLLKTARYGERRSAKGSLRHDANVTAITGVIADYDGEELAFSQLVEQLRHAGLLSVAYTTPSHTKERPRWRVIAMFSRELPTSEWQRMMGRLAGLLSAPNGAERITVIADESWALSQPYYYGGVAGRPFEIEVIDGRPIDLFGELDAGALGKAPKPSGDIDQLPPRVLKAIKTKDHSPWGGDRSRQVFYVACALVRAGWTDNRIAEVLLDPENGVSAHVLDQHNPADYAARQARQAREKVAADWERDIQGTIIADSQKNARQALEKMGVQLRYNTFDGRAGAAAEPLEDAIVNRLRFEIKERFGFRPSKEFFFDYLGYLARANPYHPVRDYLNGLLEWDGEPRIDRWLVTYLGAKDTPLARAFGRLALVAAVRRIFSPGCKFDEMVVLIDPTQGTGKSETLAKLVPDESWFTDSLPLGLDDKTIIEKTRGKWIIEIAELSGMRKTEIEKIKAFLSRQVEHARLAYDRLTTEVQRQWVPFGTTNQPVFLKDAQNRRYWTVDTGICGPEAIARDRDQLWAEALTAHRNGESIRLDPALWSRAAEAQEAHAIEDPWLYTIEDALGDQEGRIATADLFRVLNLPEGIKRPDMGQRLADIMRRLGWKGKPMKFFGKPRNGWYKGEETAVLERDRAAVMPPAA
jgi:hypothetical protein